ncbi:MAG TPA: hypothetical protein VLE49_00035, partial [Anaerolineales bacterium]|nr:hypothetical protein [Anaerolineales bacterium]
DIDLHSLMIQAYRIASITAYNRVEPNPRTPDFDRSLKAEVRDPLWMLTRQWQFGEFQGEDAASPVTAQILGEHTNMDRVALQADQVLPYDESFPLETVVEREKLEPNLFLAVQMGRYFIKLMRSKTLAGFLDRFISRYSLDFTIDRNDYEGLQLQRAASGRIFNGYDLYEDIITTEPDETQTRYLNWLDSAENNDIPSAARTQLKDLATPFMEWFQRNYSQPQRAEDSAWLPARLEYQFALASAAGAEQKTLVADQYFEGHLDWYSLDLDSSRSASPAPEPTPNGGAIENFVSFIPAPVSFKGMPNPRFWAMEENQTDFGRIDTSTTGLLHLLFAEFGLIYSNDWFMLPYSLSINTLCEIKGIVVTDVFGQHVLIRPAGQGPERDWQRWALFHHHDKANAAFARNMFYLLPTLMKPLEGEPLEQVNFLRDEMANMVWAVENIVPSQAGTGRDGKEMALEEDQSSPFTPVGEAKIRYVLGTQVPENWIPFVPVHIEGSDTEIRLQRARLPGAKGALGRLLTEKPAPYFIFEEEVPRSGVIVQRALQRARWLNGKTYLWVGRFKEMGKGEGWSNLKFDQIEPISQSQ